MFDSNAILRLYASVLEEDILRCQICREDIRRGIRDMAHTYASDPSCFQRNDYDRKYTNFNIPAYRCSYLHKYAPLHTYIVLDMMKKILKKKSVLFKNVLNSNFKLCCLGGGPGSDAVGVMAALHSAFTFSVFKPHVTIVDSMLEWKHTFHSVMKHLKESVEFGSSWSCLFNSIDWDFIDADLLRPMKNSVNCAINTASFITMVKFLSAATCTNTESMVENIFRCMQPGALVLYIDNAASCFTKIIEKAAMKYTLKVVAGPFKHIEYSEEALKVDRFGYTSCFNTKVTVILMQKPGMPQNKTQILSRPVESIPAPMMKTPLRDVQNVIQVPSQNLHKVPSQRRVTAHGRPSVPNNDVTFFNSSNKNLIPPSSKSRTEKEDYIHHQYEKFYKPVPSSSISPGSVVGSQPIAHGRPSATNQNLIRTSCSEYRSRSEKDNSIDHHYKKLYKPVAGSPVSQDRIVDRQPTVTPSEEQVDDTCCACCVIS